MKMAVCFALGGHIATQNASFRRLAEKLPEFELYGAENGFEAFETGIVYRLTSDLAREFPGFYSGASRATITDKNTGEIDENKVEKAVDFFRKGKFDITVTSGGDDHERQVAYLAKELQGEVEFYELNKTMDNDLGGIDGVDGAPYTDFTNGFHTAVERGAEFIHRQFAGAWTDGMPYLIGCFGRDVNWVGIASAYWGLADIIVYGELPEEHPGHPIDEIAMLIEEAQNENERKYGRRFAMVVIPEGTRISGLEHVNKELIDPSGHHKLEPAVLTANLKRELGKRGIKTKSDAITYDMRNSRPSEKDLEYAEMSADAIASAIREGNSGVASVFKIRDGEVYADTAPIEKVGVKRYSNYYSKNTEPLIEGFRATDAIGRYYGPLFGDKKTLKSILPPVPEKFKIS